MKPLKRIEHFLAKISGDSAAKDLSPKTRDEYYLNEIAENGGGSGGSSGSGGLNVLRLYMYPKYATPPGELNPTDLMWAYKDPDGTEEYQSYEEAASAVENADLIIVRYFTPSNSGANYYAMTSKWQDEYGVVFLICATSDDALDLEQIFLWITTPSGFDPIPYPDPTPTPGK